MRKSILSMVALGLALVGSTGTALAGFGDSGGTGKGGTATNNCLNIGIDLLSGIGVAGTGKASGASCAASANGTGGAAY